jgi:hypothetical protein
MVLIIVISIIVLACLAFAAFCEDHPSCLLFAPLSLILFIWLTIAGNAPWVIDKEFSVTVQKAGDVQCLSWTHGGKTELINLNQRFGRTFPDDASFKVKTYKSGWYRGIYFNAEDFGGYSLEF